MCVIFSISVKLFRRYEVPKVCTFDLVVTLILTLRPLKPKQLNYRLNYIMNQSLVKFPS